MTITFPDKKRNLIYIYLESMEITYADKESGGAYSENYIPELSGLALENEDFSGKENKLNGAYAMPGATWTMGALFAQTSGLPLQIGIGDNDMLTQDTFFADVVTLGDILDEEGYSQGLMIGSEGEFGGRKLYFTQHGAYDIWDYDYAKNEGLIDKNYRVFWGYEDKKLFSFAKEKIMEMSKENEPFNFTMLTVDTHFEDGYVCEECSEEFGDNQYANVMACSSRQVSEFVEWIKLQDFYENTTVVIAGDHLTMDSDFCNDIDENYNRRTYACYMNAAAENEDDETLRIYSTFDMFPTTLASLGAEIQGNKLGLGTNLFSENKTLIEQYGVEYVKSELNKKSDFIKKLANINLYTSANLESIFNPWRMNIDKDETRLELEVDVQSELEEFKQLEIDIWSPDNPDEIKTTVFERIDNTLKTVIDLSGFDYTNVCSAIYVVDNDENRHYMGALSRNLLLCEINDIVSYLEELINAKEKYSIFILTMDEAANCWTYILQEKLKELGLKESLINQYRSSYYAIVDKGEVLDEKLDVDLISTEGHLTTDNITYKLESAGYYAGNTCSALINGQEYAMRERGLNIVVYDNEINEVVDSVSFDTHSGSSLTRSYGETVLERDELLPYKNINEYLAELKNRENISVFIAVRDEASTELTQETQYMLNELGLKENLLGKYRCSYYAVIDNKNVLAEQLGFETIETQGTLSSNEDVTYKLVSAGYEYGDTCSILINGQEYAINSRGLNIVVYDNETNTVTDSVVFDTYSGIEGMRY